MRTSALRRLARAATAVTLAVLGVSFALVLALRWLDPANGKDWSIDLATAPEAQTCVLALLGAGMFLATVAAFLFARREFRMKTPAGG